MVGVVVEAVLPVLVSERCLPLAKAEHITPKSAEDSVPEDNIVVHLKGRHRCKRRVVRDTLAIAGTNIFGKVSLKRAVRKDIVVDKDYGRVGRSRDDAVSEAGRADVVAGCEVDVGIAHGARVEDGIEQETCGKVRVRDVALGDVGGTQTHIVAVSTSITRQRATPSLFPAGCRHHVRPTRAFRNIVGVVVRIADSRLIIPGHAVLEFSFVVGDIEPWVVERERLAGSDHVDEVDARCTGNLVVKKERRLLVVVGQLQVSAFKYLTR